MLVDLFGTIWNMSVFGCYIILVVMLLRLLLNKCGHKYSFLLWFVVFLNLCLPISIEGPFSLVPTVWVEWTQAWKEESTLPEQEIISADEQEKRLEMLPGMEQPEGTEIHYVQLPVGEADLNEVQLEGMKEATFQELIKDLEQQDASKQAEITNADRVDTVSSEQENVLSMDGTAQTDISWQRIACYLWIVVIAVLWGLNIVKSILLSRKLRSCRTEGMLLSDDVVVAKGLEAPFLWGLWKPVIYLPENVEGEEKSYILAHESYHRKRFDHITKLVVFVIVTIHWFNPFVWAAYALFVRDMEISCDEAVLVQSKTDIKKQYAASLLKYAAKQNGFVFSPLTFGEPSLKARIQNVLRYQKRGLVLTVVAVTVVCLTACGLITRPVAEEQLVQLGNTSNNAENIKTQEREPGETKEPNLHSGTAQKPVAQPETTDAPVDTPLLPEYIQYPPYFYEVLCAGEVEGIGQLQRDEGIEHSYTLPEKAADYQGTQPTYSANRTILLEEGAVVQMDWLSLDKDLILENLSFDMKDAFTQAGVSHGMLVDVFYDRDWNKVFVLVNSYNMTEVHQDYKEVTWLLEFAPEAPQDYQMECYDTNGAWFGECRRLGDSIFLHAGAGTTPYEINLLTKEGRNCESEYSIAKQTIQSFAKNYAKEHEKEVGVQWFSAVAQYEDVTIFSGIVAEDMDFPEVATIYLARQNGKIIQAMLVEAENGEVVLLQTVPEADISTMDIAGIQQPAEQESEWVKTIMRILEENDGNARDFGWENSVLPVFADMTGEEEAVYGDNGEVSEDNAYTLECWMKLPDGRTLEALCFELRQEMENHAWVKAFVSGVFFHRGHVFMALPAGGTGEGVMIVNFSPDRPQEYQIHAYEGISTWFGEIVMIGEDICIHGANGSYPWRINVEGWELSSTAKEFAETKKRAEAYIKALERADATQLSLQWFYASGKIDDMEIYTGYIGEDVGSVKATIYTAFQDRECVGCMVVNEEMNQVYLESELSEPLCPVLLKTSSAGAYNTVVEINGYQYYFQLDMNTAQLQSEIGESVEEERYYGKAQVKPVSVTDGVKTEQLGVLRGYVLDVTSPFLVEPSRADGERVSGKVKLTEEGTVAFYQAEAIDRDTYTEYSNVSEEAVFYELAEEAELVMLDSNFRNVSVTYDRFVEHLSRSEDTIYYIVVQAGKIIQIWEPYNP